MTQMNLSTKQKRLTDIENRPAVGKGWRCVGGIEWELGLADVNYYI